MTDRGDCQKLPWTGEDSEDKSRVFVDENGVGCGIAVAEI